MTDKNDNMTLSPDKQKDLTRIANGMTGTDRHEELGVKKWSKRKIMQEFQDGRCPEERYQKAAKTKKLPIPQRNSKGASDV